ncbi:hypothetical protein RND71_016880 [Anisodus tanguticus]|uniref:F-box domain-containing protein n=1 Tax=Anisodus tanguticus TaxID=243964 RepID=A0AAE1S9R1_9SOLA|nr:hypothetical protein RND71_016880 [Anisodus tanguticus]
MANWAELPNNLIAQIAKRVKLMEDFIVFRAVCTSWRTAARKDNFDVLSPLLPLLMLGDTYDGYRQVYSLSKQKVSYFSRKLEGKGSSKKIQDVARPHSLQRERGTSNKRLPALKHIPVVALSGFVCTSALSPDSDSDEILSVEDRDKRNAIHILIIIRVKLDGDAFFRKGDGFFRESS